MIYSKAFWLFLLLQDCLNDSKKYIETWPSQEEKEKIFSLIPENKRGYWIKRYSDQKTCESAWNMLNKIYDYWRIK